MPSGSTGAVFRETTALQVGDDDQPSGRLVLQELRGLVERGGITGRPETRRDRGERGTRVRGRAGRRYHVGAIVEGDEHDPIPLGLVDRLDGPARAPARSGPAPPC